MDLQAEKKVTGVGLLVMNVAHHHVMIAAHLLVKIAAHLLVKIAAHLLVMIVGHLLVMIVGHHPGTVGEREHLETRGKTVALEVGIVGETDPEGTIQTGGVALPEMIVDP
jgi:hypothetical protein